MTDEEMWGDTAHRLLSDAQVEALMGGSRLAPMTLSGRMGARKHAHDLYEAFLTAAPAEAPEQWLWRVYNQGWPDGHEDSTNTWGDWQIVSAQTAARLAGDDDGKRYQFVPFAPLANRSPGRSGERPHLYLPVESRLLRGPRIMSRHTHPNDPDNVWPDDGSEDRAIAEARADLRAMMREQSESRLGVYPDGNPNVGAQHAGELRGQGAEPVSATDTVVDLLQRMLEAPTSHVRPSWKEAIRPVLRSLLADAFDKAKPEPVSAPTPTEAQIVAAAEATWGKFWQQNQSRTELASFARALGAEPVSARPASEPTDDLFAAANEIHGALDSQTYDEHRRADWDLPDDHEFNVTITAKQERALSRAICAVENVRLAALQSPPSEVTGLQALPSEPVAYVVNANEGMPGSRYCWIPADDSGKFTVYAVHQAGLVSPTSGSGSSE